MGLDLLWGRQGSASGAAEMYVAWWRQTDYQSLCGWGFLRDSFLEEELQRSSNWGCEPGPGKSWAMRLFAFCRLVHSDPQGKTVIPLGKWQTECPEKKKKIELLKRLLKGQITGGLTGQFSKAFDTTYTKLSSELLIPRKSNSVRNSERGKRGVVIIFNYQVSFIQVFFASIRYSRGAGLNTVIINTATSGSCKLWPWREWPAFCLLRSWALQELRLCVSQRWNRRD